MKKNMKNIASSSRSTVRKEIKDILNSTREVKYQNTTQGGTLSTTATNIEITQNIAQGDNVNMRSGDVIFVQELELWLQISMNVSATTDHVRFLVIIDKLNTGTSPAILDVLDTVVPESAYNTYSVSSNRHRILLDEVMPMSIAGDSRAINRKWKFNLKDLKVAFTTSSASWGKNCIKGFIFDDLGALNSTFVCGYGIRYHDS